MSWQEGELYSYSGEFIKCLLNVEAVNLKGDLISLPQGIKSGIELINSVRDGDGSLIFIGNGGSAAIALHQATDFVRTCKIRAFAPLDSALLTCMANDCGYENVFSEPLKILAKKEDLLIAISSSGQSPNILKAVEVVKEISSSVITLSGFKKDNPLRKLGDVNFYVPSDSYRFVESIHLFICNWLLDFTIRSLSSD